MSWTDGPMLPFDTETTGVEEDALILSATLARVIPGQQITAYTWYLNHGVPIPEASTKVHGLTEEYLAEHGGSPPLMLEGITDYIFKIMNDGVPLVGMNAVFDLTRLDRNCRRYAVVPLSNRRPISPVIDTFVLDKGVDRYRKGKRNLAALASLYQVPWNEQEAHTSMADAIAAARVAWRIGKMYPPLGALSLQELHDLQTIWKRQQDVNFAAYLRRENKPVDPTLDGQWPVRLPAEEPESGLF